MWAEDEDSGLWDVICGTGSISIALKAEQAKPADARDEDKVKELLADAKWSKWNRKACTYIHLTCDSDIRKKWGSSTTAYVRFATLVTSFEDQSFAARFQLRHRLWTTTHDPSEPISTFIDNVQDTVRALFAINRAPSDEEVGDLLLAKLDASFDTIRTVLVNQPAEPSLQSIIAALRAYGATTSTLHSDLALVVHKGRTRPTGDFAWGNPSKNPTCCNRCGRFGHMAALCMADMPQFRKDEIRAMGNAAALVVEEAEESASYAMVYGVSDSYPNQCMI